MIPRRHFLFVALACFTIVILGVWVLVAHAQGSYTVTTSVALDTALTNVVADINAQRAAENVSRAAQTPPGTPLAMLTNQQYLQGIVVGHAQQWRIQRAREVVESVTTWADMSAQQKTKFCAAVNLSPCPP